MRTIRQQRMAAWYPSLQYLGRGPMAADKLRSELNRDGFPQLQNYDVSLVLQRLRVRDWVFHDGAWFITDKGRRELERLRLKIKEWKEGLC